MRGSDPTKSLAQQEQTFHTFDASMVEVGKPDSRLPAWASEPFSSFAGQVNDLGRVWSASSAGLKAVAEMRRLHSELAGYGSKIEPIVRRYADAIFRKDERGAGLNSAKVNLRKDFFILHAHAVLSLWGSLEVLIEDFIVAWLLHNPKTLENEAFKKVKITLAEYESLDREGRMRILVQELERAAVGKQGTNRFEQMLANLDLSGPVPESDRRAIIEMQNVRNAIVHSAGHADERLVKNCPWLNLEVRDPVKVSGSQYIRYQRAVCEYVLLLAARLTKRFDLEPKPGIGKLRSSLPL